MEVHAREMFLWVSLLIRSNLYKLIYYYNQVVVYNIPQKTSQKTHNNEYKI